MSEPTEAQIKEFWEWCGFKFKREAVDDRQSGREFEGANLLRTYGRREPEPLLGLNNLFKYAVPKIDGVFWYDFDNGRHTWIIRGVKYADIVGEAEDPALALFWALWQVKEKSNE